MKTINRDRISGVATVVSIVCFAAVVSCLAISGFLGGSALSGKIEAGHYFLAGGSKTKATYTEVNALTFASCQVLDCLFWACVPLGIAAGSLAYKYGKRRNA